jgi:diaminohydroxyphosphoribosylaminopyrimidine deaminase / 5-amino-6-(5-phosphoribosylamino)uracil reductase
VGWPRDWRSDPVKTRDTELMHLALRLAARGWGHVHPNPLVGAIVVRDGEIVGQGWHTEYGGPHAEPMALASAGEAARGATIYVTLEPCAHHGKTPPCTTAILAAGVTRVVYGATDPNARAAGGAVVLRQAGVEVEGGVAADLVREQNRIFFHRHEAARPFVALKLAVSIDGKLGERGQRSRVTDAEALAETHRLRAGHDAVMVGGATARVDDPQLTVRDVTTRKQPTRIVIDPMATLSIESKLVEGVQDVPVIVCSADYAPGANVEALEKSGVQVIRARRIPGGGLDLRDVLRRLYAAGVHSIFCEGGGRLGAALLELGLVDRLYLFLGTRFFGPSGVPAFPLMNMPTVGDWHLVRLERHGDDALLVLDPGPP